MRILNLHGLGGSFDNTNYRMIRNASPSAEIVSDTIDYKNTSPKAQMEDVRNKQMFSRASMDI